MLYDGEIKKRVFLGFSLEMYYLCTPNSGFNALNK
jgi:hypothetical protein